MSYTDLIPYEDFARDTLQGVELDGMGSAIEAAITDATAQIETHLNRKLIVREHIQPIANGEWLPNEYDDPDLIEGTRLAWADQWPIVQVETAGVSTFADNRRLKVDADDADPGSYTYFAGYRRQDQDLSALQAELSDLTTLPDVLPPDIRRCAFALATYELVRAAEGTIGRRRVQTSGPVSITVDSADRGFPERELKRIDNYRKVL